ncbi:MAG TPA: hypothetical protein VF134_06650 [Candidatus Dormibacteraeota bacterium]
MLAAATGLEAVLCGWREASLDEAGMRVGNRPVAIALAHALAGTRPEVAPVDVDEWRALDRFLCEAARAGTVTSGLGGSWSWGRKDVLERRLRAYTRRTGVAVPRPNTWLRAAAVPRGRGPVIVKLAARHRSLGVSLVAPGQSLDGAEAAVVQELLADPLLVDGHKFDLRLHVVVVPSDRLASRAVDATLVRIAALPFEPGRLESELTPNLVRLRLGLPPGIYDVRRAPFPEALRRRLASEALRLGEAFLDVYFDWLAQHPPSEPPAGRERRAFLLGLDALVRGPETAPRLLLLECNPHPFLWRHFEPCDSAVERCLRDGLAPALLSASGPPE